MTTHRRKLAPFTRLAREAGQNRFECADCGAILERRERQDGRGVTYLMIQTGDEREVKLVDAGDAVAVYAAAIATFVAARQLLTELPSVRVDGTDDAHHLTGPPGSTKSTRIYWLTVTNAGRRPVTIKKVGFEGEKDAFVSFPSEWVDKFPVVLAEGSFADFHVPLEGPQAFGGLPNKLLPIAQDSVGRWWPRRRRFHLWRRGRALRRKPSNE